MSGPNPISIAPADYTYLGLPGPALQLLLLLLALAVFVFIMWRRIGLLRLGAPDPRFDRLGRRITRMLVYGFGQSRQPRYKVAGILHILIFFGFLILSLRSLTLIGEGISPGFTLPGLGGAAGHFYASLKDFTALIVLICCFVAAARRLFFKPGRYHDRHAHRSHAGEAYLILGLISLLMIADALYEGSGMALTLETAAALPLASAASVLLQGFTASTLKTIHLFSFWIHNAALLFFLCYLPVSKHFHVITAIPNVFFMNLEPQGKIKPPRHDVSDLDSLETLGVGSLEDFTWKHILDFYSCTDCGRCSDHCPAYAAGTPLSPRMISIKSRDLAYAAYPILGKKKNRDLDTSQSGTASGTPDPAAAEAGAPGSAAGATKPTQLVGDVIADTELWACTTCGACEEACPVLIEYVDKIVDMRRRLVDDGRVPASLQKPLASVEKRGNPYGKMARKRSEWVGKQKEDQCGVRLLGQGDSADLLFFTDSCTAFDPRIQEIARDFASLLTAAGLDCGTMGKDEVDSGHEARRIGEEGLFETLRDANLEAFEARTFERVITTDPHAFNALLNGGYDLAQPVLHHSQLLAELVAQRRLRFNPLDDGKVYSFHDPCYLGRHNDIYDAPRSVLKAMDGIRLTEMDRTKNRSFCCGGGSLYLFYEGESESRMGELRLEMAERAGAQVVVTACPFCLINLEDAVKTTGREDTMEVIDLAELAARQLKNLNRQPAG